MFDDIVLLDERFVAEGKAAGRTEGKSRGFKEGEGLGRAKGFSVGAEVGFYQSCCMSWLAFPTRFTDFFPTFSDKALGTMKALVKLADGIPRDNCRDAKVLQDTQRIRAKFRAVTAMVGFLVVFNPEGQ
ncbi:unnamed protein product, partial [Choristocarpus tenellus]